MREFTTMLVAERRSTATSEPYCKVEFRIKASYQRITDVTAIIDELNNNWELQRQVMHAHDGSDARSKFVNRWSTNGARLIYALLILAALYAGLISNSTPASPAELPNLSQHLQRFERVQRGIFPPGWYNDAGPYYSPTPPVTNPYDGFPRGTHVLQPDPPGVPTNFCRDNDAQRLLDHVPFDPRCARWHYCSYSYGPC